MKKVALVTGAARGIGFGIARCLAESGYDLAICATREESQVMDALTELRVSGADVLYCQCDISEADDRKNMINSIKDHFGRLNVLVNNAGVAPKVRADLLEVTEESYEWVMKVNLQGPYFLTQAVANWMIEQQKETIDFEGCIINIASISSTTASINRGEYCVSKAGMSMATKLWATRLGEFKIPVYEVRPGITATDMTSGVKEKYDKLIADGLLVQQRWGVPEDVGKAVLMLAENNLPYSTGQVIMVDGGFSIDRL